MMNLRCWTFVFLALTISLPCSAHELTSKKNLLGAQAPFISLSSGLQFETISFTQKVSSTSSATFSQRVYFSKTFAKDNNSPVIYYFCGEQDCEERQVAFLGNLAKASGAYVVGVEHRFYGKSSPPVNQVSDLKNLSSESAIADLAEIQKSLVQSHNLNGPWFSLGGSYPGTLAAYYRILHPELVQGAFAFSAPLQINDQGIPGYELVGQTAFGPELTAKIKVAINYIYQQSQSDSGKIWIKSNLKMPDLNFSPADILSVLVNVVPGVAQEGQVSGLKKAMTDGQTPEQAAAALSAFLNQISFGEPLWAESPYGVRQDPSLKSNISRWVYQAYHEFGWLYVSAEDGKSLLPAPLNMDYYAREDGKVFSGVPLMSASAFPKKMLNSLTTDASRIIIINGSLDPWSAVSLANYSAPERLISSHVIDCGSHCAGMNFPAVLDPHAPEYQAQNAILKAMVDWSVPTKCSTVLSAQ